MGLEALDGTDRTVSSRGLILVMVGDARRFGRCSVSGPPTGSCSSDEGRPGARSER